MLLINRDVMDMEVEKKARKWWRGARYRRRRCMHLSWVGNMPRAGSHGADLCFYFYVQSITNNGIIHYKDYTDEIESIFYLICN